MFVGRAEAIEQVKRLIKHPVRTRTVTVDLVDDDHRNETLSKRLLRNKTGLRHWSLNGIDEQQHAVDHREHALDLAAEVGMTGGIDDIDAITVPVERGVLGENCDTALTFEIV